MPGKPHVIIGVSIVNYKTAKLVTECLGSLLADINQGLIGRVVVVDNLSEDDSVRILTEYVQANGLEPTVEIVAAEKNGGFSYGNNIAFKRLTAQKCDYIWLLNPDTRVLPGAAEALVRCLAEESNAGVAGSRLQDEDGTPQIAAFNYPTPLGELVNRSGMAFMHRLFPKWVIAQPIPLERADVQWVAGASMMVDTKVVETVGLMDEGYFLYFEEVDYCRLINLKGFRILYEPESKVIHHVGAATGISETRQQAPRRPAYWFESRRRYFQKNFGYWHSVLADLYWLLGQSARNIKRILKREENLEPPHFLVDMLRQSNLAKGRIIGAGGQVGERQQTEGSGVSQKSNRDSESAGFWQLLREDWAANGKDWTRPGFRALAVYRFGVWRIGVRSKWLRAPLSVFYRFLFRRVRNGYGIELPYSASLGRRIVIEHQGAIVVHGNTVLGDGCIIRQGVTLGNRDLASPLDAPCIGKGVNIGAGAKILGAVTVGDNATIGANAVVLKHVPANAVAVGVPARIVSARE